MPMAPWLTMPLQSLRQAWQHRPAWRVASAPSGRVRVVVWEPDHFRYLQVQVQPNGLQVLAWDTVPRANRSLRQWLAAIRARRFGPGRTVILLSTGDVQVLQIEAPRVPLAQLAQAARWAVRDLLVPPGDEWKVDALLLSDDTPRYGQMALVLGVPVGRMRELAQYSRQVRLEPEAVEVLETGWRNVLLDRQARSGDSRAMALLLQLDDELMCLICGHGELLEARRIPSEAGVPILGEGGHRVVAEVVRSFDRFERRFPDLSIGIVWVEAGGATADMIQAMEATAGIQAMAFDLLEGLSLSPGLPAWPGPVQVCGAMLGAALRPVNALNREGAPHNVSAALGSLTGRSLETST